MTEIRVVVTGPEEAYNNEAEFWRASELLGVTVIHEGRLHLRIDGRADGSPWLADVISLARALARPNSGSGRTEPGGVHRRALRPSRPAGRPPRTRCHDSGRCLVLADEAPIRPKEPSMRSPIVLIHGLWLTPRSWEGWKARFEQRGHEVLTPAWPRMEGEVEALRRDPSVMNGLGLAEVIDHYERIIRSLDTAPIIMGHSTGGLLMELLLDRGLAA